jgi:hypothetical protein
MFTKSIPLNASIRSRSIPLWAQSIFMRIGYSPSKQCPHYSLATDRFMARQGCVRPDCRALKIASEVRNIRCMASKSKSAKIQFLCNSCGNTAYQYFGKCSVCGEFGTCVLTYGCLWLCSYRGSQLMILCHDIHV